MVKQVLVTSDDYVPHAGQAEFHISNARFRILACGRRWGKDYCTIHEAIKYCFPQKALVWWVAPQYSQTRIGWEMALAFLNYDLVASVNRGELFIEFVNGSQLWFKSADNPDALRGRGIDFLVIDEAALIKREAWENVLRPSLSDTRGKAVFIGTPKGYNWFFEMWTRGNDPLQSDYRSWSYPTASNPHIPPTEIEEAQKTLPEPVFKQEYLANFIEDVGSVFRNVDSIVKGDLEPPNPAKTYVAGADLAKQTDYTVIDILDNNGHLCAHERFSQLDWVFQRKRISNMVRLYNARLIIDSTGVGDPILDGLHREQLAVEGYKFTNASKKDLIENLSMMIDNRQITAPGKPAVSGNNGEVLEAAQWDIPELGNELKMFGYTQTPSGVLQYGAPQGYHDDCVVALALAAWQLRKPTANITFL